MGTTATADDFTAQDCCHCHALSDGESKLLALINTNADCRTDREVSRIEALALRGFAHRTLLDLWVGLRGCRKDSCHEHCDMDAAYLMLDRLVDL